MNLMMNEYAKKDLSRYKSITLWSAAVLFSVILLLLLASWFLDVTPVQKPLLGGLLGTMLATINLFALGYAFYALAIKKMARWVIMVPLSTFIIMAITSFILAIYHTDYILGFALGLTAPVSFGAVIVFGNHKPEA